MDAPALPSWKLWRLRELPPEWQQQPTEDIMCTMAAKLGIPRQELTYAVCITMPQCQLSLAYQQWAQQQEHPTADTLGLMIESVDEWIETNNYPDLVTWGSLFLQDHRPPMFISGIFGRASGVQ